MGDPPYISSEEGGGLIIRTSCDEMLYKPMHVPIPPDSDVARIAVV